jgi:hypothetical protein
VQKPPAKAKQIAPVAAAILCLTLTTPAGAMPLATRAHLVSIGLGSVHPAPSLSPGEGQLRALDVAIGPRLRDNFAVMAWLVPAEAIPSYYRTQNNWAVMSSGGVMATWMSSASRWQTLAVTAAVRGCNGWGLVSPGARFVEAAIGAGATLWAFNPAVEVGWRYEFTPAGEVEGPHWTLPHDRVWFMLKVGLGGVYSFDS